MRPQIRDETPRDLQTIGALAAQAYREVFFSPHTEQHIIAALRHTGDLTVSLVAEHQGVIVGHVAASPVRVVDGTTEHRGWYALGPLSVSPAWQGEGVGTALVQAALQGLKALGAAGCVTRYHAPYFRRFGFRPARPLKHPEVPAREFLALCWAEPVPAGVVRYHPAFAARA